MCDARRRGVRSQREACERSVAHYTRFALPRQHKLAYDAAAFWMTCHIEPCLGRITMTTKLIRFGYMLLFCGGFSALVAGCTVTVDDAAEPAEPSAAPPGQYLFCHWNVENFFDDKPDKRTQKADQEFDAWFASN